MNNTQTKKSTLEPSSSKPRRLGRGLSALLGEPVRIDLTSDASDAPLDNRPSVELGTQNASAARAPASVESRASDEPVSGSERPRVVMVALSAIVPSRYQPRRAFDEHELATLAQSIKSAGLIQPIVVRPSSVAGEAPYELIAGERRWRAAQIAGLARIPAIISNADDAQAAEWALIENLHRADLRPMERADAVRALVERFQLSHAQAAEKLGMDRSSVANLIRMTELEMAIREMLDAGTLSAGHAKALLGVADSAARVRLAQASANLGWSVRKLEQAVHVEMPTGATASGPAARADDLNTQAGGPVQASAAALARAAAMRDLEKQLAEHLGTSVRVRTSAGGKRGSLVIKFFDLDHFDGLMHKIGFVLK